MHRNPPPSHAPQPVNGIDVAALTGVIRDVAADPAKGAVQFHVATAVAGPDPQPRRRSSRTASAARRSPRSFQIDVDEPLELLGTNTAPNPQEMLMTALNACMMVGYVVGAAVEGITLEKVEIETSGELDLRGFLGIDPTVRPGYESMQYTVRIKGNGTPEQFREDPRHGAPHLAELLQRRPADPARRRAGRRA